MPLPRHLLAFKLQDIAHHYLSLHSKCIAVLHCSIEQVLKELESRGMPSADDTSIGAVLMHLMVWRLDCLQTYVAWPDLELKA
jgi:hypothetical protein